MLILTSCLFIECVFCCVTQGVPAGDGADQAPGGEACEERSQRRADRYSGNSSALPEWTSATHRQHQAEAHILPSRLHRGWERSQFIHSSSSCVYRWCTAGKPLVNYSLLSLTLCTWVVIIGIIDPTFSLWIHSLILQLRESANTKYRSDLAFYCRLEGQKVAASAINSIFTFSFLLSFF